MVDRYYQECKFEMQTWTEGSIAKLSERGANPRHLPNNIELWRLEES